MTETPSKVVHYSPVWLPLTETWLYNQVRHLPRTVENHIVCRSVRHLNQFRIPNNHCLKRESFARYLLHQGKSLLGSRGRFPYFERKIREIQPDVVHSHFGNNGWTVREAVRKQGIKHVVSFYGQDVSKLPKKHPDWYQRYRQLFEDEGTLFLCEGNAMANAVHKLGCALEKIRIHHLGVEIEHIRFEPRAWSPGETFKVLIAASLREKKGISYGLEALGRLSKEIPLEITIIGDASDSKAGQEEKNRILGVIERHALGPITRLLGYQPYDVFWEEAYRHHLFLSPSVTALNGDTEGGVPVAIIEMVASGMPIVSSFHCDIPEVVKHGETGWLAEERSVASILDCMHKWLDGSSDWNRFLSAGRRHMEREYDAVQQGLRLAEIYRGVR